MTFDDVATVWQTLNVNPAMTRLNDSILSGKTPTEAEWLVAKAENVGLRAVYDYLHPHLIAALR